MAGIQVNVKYGKVAKDLEFENADATLGELRDAIEFQMSVPKATQQLICAGKRWQGIAFGDDLKILDAAGPKGTKEVMGVKVVSLMLMAPPGADGGDAVQKCVGQVQEVKEILGELPSESDGAKKKLLLADDLLTKAATSLDNLNLVGAQRERRKELIREIDTLGERVAEKRAAL
eukprot:TRINITY_DN26336_c0_g1_i1.p1 TRINITY_DN26336_c0_g1~~TRINITY_DN26336_c0_g1_i1.p1  ORF type:complete len:189 (+),score=48.72 TRINITY_DN26336_c0_g1_i1:43-567(+)